MTAYILLPFLWLLGAAGLVGCSLEAKSPREGAASGEDASVKVKSKKSKKQQASDDEESSSTRPADDDEDDEEDDDEEDDDKKDEAKKFFEDELSLHLEEECSQCHAPPRSGVTDPAPLSIFSYTKMKAKITGDEDDTPFSASTIYKKVRGVTTHGGGDQCGDTSTLENCRLIAEWWELVTEREIDLDLSNEPPPLDGEKKPGALLDITDVGRVTGWAADPANASTTISITAYIDGDAATGTQIHQGAADQAGFDGDTDGNHAFAFDVPVNYRDGMQHTLSVYAMIAGTAVLLEGSPKTFTALTPSQAGRNYFDANVRAAMNGCTGCHAIAYDQQWESLRVPSPAAGGTATTNTLIRKALGELNHGGGVRCQNANAAPCLQFQEWWRIEFGP